jgi:hypothetical protein
MWWIYIGLPWGIWSVWYNSQQRHAVRENWFPVLFFGTLLWPFFMSFAYEKGMAPKPVASVINWIKNKAKGIYG